MKYFLLLILTSTVLIACKKDLVDTNQNEITDITTLDAFKEQISKDVSMVFFHASWCATCEELRPTVEKISENDTIDYVRFLEVDYDDNRDVFSEYEVNGFPQLLFFRDGLELERLIGKNQSEEKILRILRKYK